MRIVIDMQGAQGEHRNRGIGRYTMAFTQSLIRNCPDHEIIIILNGFYVESVESIRIIFNKVLPYENIKIWYPLTYNAFQLPEYSTKYKISEGISEIFLSCIKPDVFIVSNIFEELNDDILTGVSKNNNSYLTVSILYDLIPLIYPDTYLKNQNLRVSYLKKISILQKFDLQLAISASSMNDSIKLLGVEKKCINISCDADSKFRRTEKTENEKYTLKKKYGIINDFIMYTGGIDERKNIEGLIRAYSILSCEIRQFHQLVIVCNVNGGSRNKLLVLARNQGLTDGEVILTGYVSEEDLIGLYNYCYLFVFPSWHEGFGLPVLEAMRCGAPVIGSNITSMPEVIGMDEALFDPYSDISMAALIERSLLDKTFHNRLLANAQIQSSKFSWENTVKSAIGKIECAYIEKNNKAIKKNKEMKRARLAYVSPLPPERSGISDYSALLLRALSEHYEIEVIVDQREISDHWISENLPVRDLRYFYRNSDMYDRILYHFGNSQFHKHMFAMLLAVPGIVVLHDFYLSGVAYSMQATGYTKDFFSQSLYKSHGYHALVDMSNNSIKSAIWKYPLNKCIFENSIGTIVHSNYPVQLGEEWYGLDNSYFKIIPLIRAPIDKVDSLCIRKALGFNENDFIVASFGVVGPHKLNNRLLKAWIESDLSKNKNCHLIFVGENESGDFGAEIMLTISQSPCPGQIHVTGWINKSTYDNYLVIADVGVQLRSLSRGETSAAVLDCMSHGLPTIVNANGSMAEINHLWMLDDHFKDAELIQALEALWQDPQKRKKLGSDAGKFIRQNHNPEQCAMKYAENIEKIYDGKSNLLIDLGSLKLGNYVAFIDEKELQDINGKIKLNFSRGFKSKQILMDISNLLHFDADNKNFSSTLENIINWISKPPKGFRVEPVYLKDGQGYFYGRSFTESLLNLPQEKLFDEPIEFGSGDVLLILGASSVMLAENKKFYYQLQNQGVKVIRSHIDRKT